MYRINFAMEDSLRDMMYRMVGDYTKMMQQFCPDSVEVISNDNVVVKGDLWPPYKCCRLEYVGVVHHELLLCLNTNLFTYILHIYIHEVE